MFSVVVVFFVCLFGRVCVVLIGNRKRDDLLIIDFSRVASSFTFWRLDGVCGRFRNGKTKQTETKNGLVRWSSHVRRYIKRCTHSAQTHKHTRWPAETKWNASRNEAIHENWMLDKILTALDQPVWTNFMRPIKLSVGRRIIQCRRRCKYRFQVYRCNWKIRVCIYIGLKMVGFWHRFVSGMISLY